APTRTHKVTIEVVNGLESMISPISDGSGRQPGRRRVAGGLKDRLNTRSSLISPYGAAHWPDLPVKPGAVAEHHCGGLADWCVCPVFVPSQRRPAARFGHIDPFVDGARKGAACLIEPCLADAAVHAVRRADHGSLASDGKRY